MLFAVDISSGDDRPEEPRSVVVRRRIVLGLVMLAVVAAFIRNVDKLFG
jgi:hypothetical protein